MFSFEAYSKDGAGNVKNESVTVSEKDGILAIYADSISRNTFDTEEAVTVRIILPGDISEGLAISEESPYWTKPVFLTSPGEVPVGTQIVLFKKKKGGYVAVVAVTDKNYKTNLIGSEGYLFSRTFSWYADSSFCDELFFVCGEGDDPFALLHNCYNMAVKLLDNNCRLREERVYPSFLEYLGWCSWDSMQIRVNEEGIKEKCEEFIQKNIPVKWAIIDDMWAEIRDFYGEEYSNDKEMLELMHRSKLYSYKADPIRFPGGLKRAADIIHGFGMRAGIWYPSSGYWAGIDKNGQAFETIGEYTLETKDGAIVPDFEPSKAYMYYKAVFAYFKESGIDFIKIDNQALPLVHYKGIAPIGITARGAASGQETAASEFFKENIINCMGMSEEMMWNRSSSGVSRCSNDFLPENRKWFAKHILQCTYNGLTQGQLYYNDFDMWWTDDGQAGKNSLLRAVSGGPVYVSDKIGRTIKKVLDPLVLSDGRILRCDRCGIPSKDCLFSDPRENGRIFKVQNSYKTSGVLAVFDLDKEEKSVEGRISPSDIYGLPEGEYVVYEHFSKEFKILSYSESFDIILKNNDDFKLYIFVPIINGFAAIGRTDKYISPATINHVCKEKIVLEETGPYAYVKDGEICFEGESDE